MKNTHEHRANVSPKSAWEIPTLEVLGMDPATEFAPGHAADHLSVAS